MPSFSAQTCSPMCPMSMSAPRTARTREAVPKLVFYTSKWRSEKQEERQLKVLPEGTEMRYYNDSAMELSVRRSASFPSVLKAKERSRRSWKSMASGVQRMHTVPLGPMPIVRIFGASWHCGIMEVFTWTRRLSSRRLCPPG